MALLLARSKLAARASGLAKPGTTRVDHRVTNGLENLLIRGYNRVIWGL